MPGMDGTGPIGGGPMTGGGYGRCNPNGNTVTNVGRGVGRRGNRRFFRRNMSTTNFAQADYKEPETASADKEQGSEMDELRKMVEQLRAENEDLRRQLDMK